MKLGCIADDFTGATDLANMLVKGGMRTIQSIGIPTQPLNTDADAVVIALKSRTIAPEDAVAQSREALEWLRANHAQQVYFKYCSTFDSTPRGNIGPVTDMLMDTLKVNFTIACPAFPENGRTIFRGYLFAGDVLLSESGMREHPLTPMTDPNLVRVLQAQTKRKIGLVKYDEVARGPNAIRDRFSALKEEGVEIAVVDAVSDADLISIGDACEGLGLVTAGSGVGLGMAFCARHKGHLPHFSSASQLPRVFGHSAVISGSCSPATNAQVAEWKKSRDSFRVDPLAIAAGKPIVRQALDWAVERLPRGPILVYATSHHDEVREAQDALGIDEAGRIIEGTLAEIGRGLVDAGVRKLIVAGGETSGAVVQALGIKLLRIGPQISPGVPWTISDGIAPMALALKSGNFGEVDFFSKALAQLS